MIQCPVKVLFSVPVLVFILYTQTQSPQVLLLVSGEARLGFCRTQRADRSQPSVPGEKMRSVRAPQIRSVESQWWRFTELWDAEESGFECVNVLVLVSSSTGFCYRFLYVLSHLATPKKLHNREKLVNQHVPSSFFCRVPLLLFCSNSSSYSSKFMVAW